MARTRQEPGAARPSARRAGSHERTRQKARTRAALVAAASELLTEGRTPTVPEVAERAGVSRATAYRYFPTQEALLLEAVDVSPMVAPVEAALAGLDRESAGDVAARLERLVDTFNPIVVGEEVKLRIALRSYLDASLTQPAGDTAPIREGRRTRWLETVLEPLGDRLDEERRRRLISALSLTMGIEAVVVLRDVCHVVDDDELLGDLRWAATTLARAALAGD